MKIIKLSAENIKRLKAVEITPEGNVVTIGGKNGAGKTSVLDSIAYALGGATLVPDQPIRMGESEANIEIELDDYIIIRHFQLRLLPCNCGNDSLHPDSLQPEIAEHERLCNSLKTAKLNSSLTVKNKDGSKFSSPQAMLDELLGSLSFDPLKFSRVPAKEQAQMLRDLVGIDVSDLDNKRRTAYEHRTSLNRQISNFQSIIDFNLPKHEGVPEKELSMEEVSSAMLDAEEKRTKLNELYVQHEELKTNLAYVQSEHREVITQIERYESRIEEMKTSLGLTESSITDINFQIKEITEVEEKAKSEIPDVNAIRARLEEIQNTNVKVRANKKRSEVVAEQLQVSNIAKKESLAIIEIDMLKQEKLASIKFPIEGLGIDYENNVVTYNGIPFNQASTAEQLKISVAIGLAFNTKLKILLIRDGNALDSDSLKVISEQAAKADAQLWLERVAESKDGIAVMIEDGTVV